MSDASEKPFEATPRRMLQARREGNVARSSELAANVSFAAAAILVAANAPLFGAVACNALARATSERIPALEAGGTLAVALLCVGCAAAAGAAACLLQTGGLVLVAVAPKIVRLDPVEGFKRICSRDTLAHSLRAMLAFVCATLAMAPWIAAGAAAMLRAASAGEAAASAWKAAQAIGTAAVAVGLCFSFAEYGAARSVWLRKLRMSFEERKRETKEEEGDGVIRGRRRAMHRAFVRGGMSRVKEAAFVVVNPAHVAVALAYRPPDIPVPLVLVRASDELALRVRQIARLHRVPIVENVGLARALYREARSGEPIPHALYVAVAEVVAALLRAAEAAG